MIKKCNSQNINSFVTSMRPKTYSKAYKSSANPKFRNKNIKLVFKRPRVKKDELENKNVKYFLVYSKKASYQWLLKLNGKNVEKQQNEENEVEIYKNVMEY